MVFPPRAGHLRGTGKGLAAAVQQTVVKASARPGSSAAVAGLRWGQLSGGWIRICLPAAAGLQPIQAGKILVNAPVIISTPMAARIMPMMRLEMVSAVGDMSRATIGAPSTRAPKNTR